MKIHPLFITLFCAHILSFTSCLHLEFYLLIALDLFIWCLYYVVLLLQTVGVCDYLRLFVWLYGEFLATFWDLWVCVQHLQVCRSVCLLDFSVWGMMLFCTHFLSCAALCGYSWLGYLGGGTGCDKHRTLCWLHCFLGCMGFFL